MKLNQFSCLFLTPDPHTHPTHRLILRTTCSSTRRRHLLTRLSPRKIPEAHVHNVPDWMVIVRSAGGPGIGSSR